ncbi:MAG: cytochrome c [Saprospiraceae bacterium]|nr:cytochrome c [Saprospiraceae bacterium]
MKYNIYILILIVALIKACSPAEGNNPGHEYMSDMGHAVSYEANSQQYYDYHHWGGIDDYRKYAIPRNPVKGTVPRGSVSSSLVDSLNTISYVNNGHRNYYYSDTEEERARASREIVSNAIPISKKVLENGKTNYLIYCGICHGEKGDGAGYLVRDDGGKYPAQPANLINDDFIAATEGRLYHAIMYGKNVMNGYSNKLSYNERWEVIHYIRSLQAGSKNLKYTETENTFTNSQAVSDARKASINKVAATIVPASPVKK